MELKSGFKRSEVGVIPVDWTVAKLGAHATFKTGPFGSALHKSDYVHGGIPLINPMQIEDGKIVPTPSMAISAAAAVELAAFCVEPGEIVIGRRGEMGRCALVLPEQQGWLCGTGSMIIRAKASLDGGFAQRLLSSPSVISAIENSSVGTTMINLNQGTLSNLLLPIPPKKAEQEAIAEALSDADALIESLEQLLVKKRQIKQGTMQELLTGKRRLPGFDGEWVSRQFGDIAQPRKERIDPRHSSNEDFCVELEHVGQGTGYLVGHTSTTDESSLKTVFQVGDVLFGKLRAYLRKYWLADRAGVCSTEIWALVAKLHLLMPQFLFQLVTTDGFIEAASSTYGTHMPRSDWKVVKAYELQLPAMAEQTAIATILSDMDADLAALESRLAKARHIKQGMMQQLLTGQIRLV